LAPTDTPTSAPTPTEAPTVTPQPTSAPCVHHGDVNDDGQITPGDAQLAFYYYIDCAELAPTEEQYCAADFCGVEDAAPCDGSVTPSDAQGIMRQYLGYAQPCAKGGHAAQWAADSAAASPTDTLTLAEYDVITVPTQFTLVHTILHTVVSGDWAGRNCLSSSRLL